MPAKKTEVKELTFEEALVRLNEIADLLENQNPTLEQALSLYEEGASLLKKSAKQLSEAEAKITILTKK